MAEVYKSVGAVLGATAADIYTVPASTTAVVTFAQATNVNTTGTYKVTLQWYCASDATTYTLANAISIPPNAAVGLIDVSKLFLAAGDKLKAFADTASVSNLTISVLEMS